MMQQVRSSMVSVFMLRADSSLMMNMHSNIVKMEMMKQQQRLMVGKASRSGVHGAHVPPTHTLDDVEAVEKEINKGEKDKEAKRKQVEEAVDAHLKRSGRDRSAPTN